jgi:uncharacterized membrane protein
VCGLCAAATNLVVMERSLNERASAAVALLATGLLAGALWFGWSNVDPTFAAVPLDVHLAFRVQLQSRNAVIMPALMGASLAAIVWFAIAARGRTRIGAVISAAFIVVTTVVTQLGNVPINREMRQWAAGELAPDYQERLQVWGMFNDIRVAAAVAAFAMLVGAVAVVVRTRQVAWSAR